MNLDRIRALLPGGLKKSLVLAISDGPLDGLVRRMFPRGVPHYGSRIPARRPGQAARLFFGFYERAEIYMSRRLLPRGLDVVELGGSLGANTCLLARKSRRVITLEGDPILASELRDTVARNGLENVTVIAKALASGRSSVTFGKGNSNLGGHIADHGLKVPATSLSAVLAEQGIGEFALVSDCEGAEIGILEREPEALRNCKLILVEMGGVWEGTNHSADQVAQMFVDRGFRSTYRYGPCAAFVPVR